MCIVYLNLRLPAYNPNVNKCRPAPLSFWVSRVAKDVRLQVNKLKTKGISYISCSFGQPETMCVFIGSHTRSPAFFVKHIGIDSAKA